jgi:hypothetical protein
MEMDGAIQVSILHGGGDRHGTLRSILDMAGTVILMVIITGIMIMDLLLEGVVRGGISGRDAPMVLRHGVLEQDISNLQCEVTSRLLLQVMYRQEGLRTLFQEITHRRTLRHLPGSTVRLFASRSIGIK